MRKPDRELVAMLAATAVLAVVSCVLRQASGDAQGPWLSDLRVMWFERGLDVDRFPFSSPVPGQPILEYPALGALLMWLSALPAQSYTGFLWLIAIVLGACAMGITALLYPIVGRATWFWAAGPPLVWSLLGNYDAVPALLSVAALALLAGRDPATISHGRLAASAALLGLGGAAKLYPLILVLPVVAWVLAPSLSAGVRRAGTVIGAAVGTFALVNLPFLIISPDGWLAPYRFQASRPISIDTLSIWTVFGAAGSIPQTAVNLAAALATVLGLAGVAVLSWRRGAARRAYALLPAAAAFLAVYLVTNKVYSPQYTLWLLPLLLLAGIKTSMVVTYLVLDALLAGALAVSVSTDGPAMVAGMLTVFTVAAVRLIVTVVLARQALAST